MKNYWITGISEGFHDASKCIINNDGEILYAGHAERYSRIKNDRFLSDEMPKNQGDTVFYEKPLAKSLRRIFSHGKFELPRYKYDHYINHHWSHAAASYYTRPFKDEPVCVVIDGVGEWDTASIWFQKKKVWSMKYPSSLGLFYSAITKSIGLKPNEDEYITMGMAAFGEPVLDLSYLLDEDLISTNLDFKVRNEDVAASAQVLIEKEILAIMRKARSYSPYLCYGGGVALNCVANSKLKDIFAEVWILPNPGDGGSSLGAAAAYIDKPIMWNDPYLGYDIKGDVNPTEVVDHLLKYKVCGIANGRAEFGPRALGNRSLIADPRYDIKDTVNDIKRRQRFRPFAPAILEEYAHKYFSGPMNEYMQYVAQAEHDYDSVTHIDGTARVQLVKRNCTSVLRPILEEWYEKTGCPMLLNTSLNIKGFPMVNDKEDAFEFQKKYNIKVF